MKPPLASCLAASSFLLVSLPLLAQQPEHGVFDSSRGSAEELPEGLSHTDWSSIRAAWEAGRHAAVASGEGFRTWTPGQGWATEFDRDGATTMDDAGGWTWGLELASWGFAGALTEVEEAASVRADGGRVSLEWGARLTEWWINDARGLEHGFTVHGRPKGGELGGPLRFTLDVSGGLQPEIAEGGRSARFVDAGGATALDYSGLVAFDARGLDLSAWMEVADGQFVLCVDECGAVYPITVDPVVQTAYVKASNTGDQDNFGYSVAVSGDTVVIGALKERSNATGVNGNQSNNSAFGAGAVYVFTRNGATWSQQAYLKASNTEGGDNFGSSVAVSGDTVVVAAVGEDSNATGVNGGQSDNSMNRAGAAYVFTRSGTTWSQEAYLKASNTDVEDLFGSSVAVSRDTVVVGAPWEDSNATGVNGDPSDNSAPFAGAAYVFTRNGTTWSQQAYLKASNTDAYDGFGGSVAVFGDTVVVGAGGEASSATGVGGGQSDNSAQSAGAAYVFTRSGTTWSQEAYLKASNTNGNDAFGWSVAVFGDTVVVGAFGEGSSATGVNGGAAAEADNSLWQAGAAYVFRRSGTTWSQAAYLKASNTDDSDRFGDSVAIFEDTVVVGARFEDSNATGVGGDQSDNSAFRAGAAYVFTRSGTTWNQLAYLKASNAGVTDEFGDSVAIFGDTVVVGAPSEDSNASGVNGAQFLNFAAQAGAAYIFDLNAPGLIGTNDCTSNPNSTGAAGEITAIGLSTAADNNLTLTASRLPIGQFGIFVTSDTTTAGSTVGAGVLCLGGQVGRYDAPGQILQVDLAGEFSLALDLTQTPLPSSVTSVMAGDTRSWQAWHRDFAGTSLTSNYTNSVTVTFN